MRNAESYRLTEGGSIYVHIYIYFCMYIITLQCACCLKLLALIDVVLQLYSLLIGTVSFVEMLYTVTTKTSWGALATCKHLMCLSLYKYMSHICIYVYIH